MVKKKASKKRKESDMVGFSLSSLMDTTGADLDPAADELLSVAQVAEIRGTSRIAVHDLISRGRLEAVTIAGRKFVSRAELEAFERQSPPGRPKKGE